MSPKEEERIKKAFQLLNEPNLTGFFKEMTSMFKKPLPLNVQLNGVSLGRQLITNHPKELGKYLDYLGKENGINTRDSKTGRTLLGFVAGHAIQSETDIEVITALVNNGARLNIKDNEDRTPLMMAIKVGAIDRAIQLLSYSQVAKNEVSCEGKGVLHTAIELNQSEVVRILLKNPKEIAVNVIDEIGETPLHYAVRGGKTQYVLWLLRAGADPKIKNAKGATPYHLLPKETDQWSSEQQEIAECLRRFDTRIENREGVEGKIPDRKPLVQETAVQNDTIFYKDRAMVYHETLHTLFGRELIPKEHRLLVEALKQPNEEDAYEIWKALASNVEGPSWGALREEVVLSDLIQAVRAANVMTRIFGKPCPEEPVKKRTLG